MITFYLQVINNLGTFNCEQLEANQLDYFKFKENLKTIYQEPIFESEMDDGSYLVMSNDLIKNTIFKIIILNT